MSSHAFPAIYLTEEDDPAPRVTHFDNGFDVLFDNGTNVSIGISKDDFIHLEERKGSLSGVGTATAEGIGTLHFRTCLDDGQLLDVTCPNAPYVPSMDIQILSIDQWGRSRTQRRTDECEDHTHMVATPDEDQSIIGINKNRQLLQFCTLMA